MIEDFYRQLSNVPVQDPVMVPVKIGNNPLLNKQLFYSNLLNSESIPDYELYNIIKGNIDFIVSDVINPDADINMAGIFSSAKFLDSFVKVIKSMPITYEKRVCCNKLAYDFLTFHVDDPATDIKQSYISLSRAVNKDSISRLVNNHGLDISSASNLALARYSSTKEIVNVKRLNFVICNLPTDNMSEQMIIFIYEEFFNQISDLFIGTMLEVYSDDEESLYGDDFTDIYSTVSLAVLTILNNMPSDKIRLILNSYVRTLECKGQPPVRFSMRALSVDFCRISSIVESLQSQGIIVP